MVCRSTILFSLLGASAFASPLLTRQSDDSDNSTLATFEKIPISKDINYVPCFENFTCARLEVPLDYQDPEIGTTHVALMRWNTPKQPAKGDIIFNPGGPGLSAIDSLMALEKPLISILGDQYNVVALEPRSIKYSGPNLNCFAGDPEAQAAYFATAAALRWDDERRRAMLWESQGAIGKWCSQTVNDTANYVNTPAIAGDMLHYSELLAKSQGKPCNESKVDYHGISYGSTLGMTFAQLYPERVGKFIIDGVVDLEDYYFGNWSQNILQADESIESLFDACADVGSRCALNTNGSTAASIKKRVDDLLIRLVESPVSVTDPELASYPVTIDDTEVRSAMRNAIYTAEASFSDLANGLAQLETGNASSFTNAVLGGAQPSDIWGSIFTRCTDNNKRYGGTKEDMEELFALHRNISTYVGESWAAGNMLTCRGLRFEPPVSQQINTLKKVKTSTDILFTANTIDGLTSSAAKMSEFFDGSVVLTQKAIGHGIIIAKSNCTSGAIQAYLDTGKLPEPNTLCDTSFQAFPEPK